MTAETFVLVIVAAATSVAAVIDLRTRRVPNAFTMPLAASGVLIAAAGWGTVGVGAALGGWAVGLLLMLPGYLIGATGGGDVKLFAAVGALLGPSLMVPAFLHTAIAGAALALAVSAWRGRVRETVAGTALLVATHGGYAPALESPAMRNRFAYAPAIAVGAVLTATQWWI
jgi:prepilin peptidase CpaA